MPRGDGKKPGERRVRRKGPQGLVGPHPNGDVLEARIRSYENMKDADKLGFTKPGSQHR